MAEPGETIYPIYKVMAGSRAYGLDSPQSDIDIRGVGFPARHYLLGLSRFEQWEQRDEQGDSVIYGLVKFVQLALAGNPNIIELLYVEPRHILFLNEYGQRLLQQRDLFLSKQVRHTFAGYALSQLKRIEGHHRWLVNPPDHQPVQEEFGGWPVKGRYKFPDHDAERAYQAALKHWHDYQTWQQNRNPARAELERQYGFDTKHAVHLLRLLKMGVEILSTGQVHVYRPDREWLREVRQGLLSYEELLEVAASYETQLGQLYETSSLPDQPNFEVAEALVMELQEQYLWETRCTTP